MERGIGFVIIIASLVLIAFITPIALSLENTNSSLPESPVISKNLQGFARMVFAIKTTEDISLERFIILVCVFIMALFILIDIFQLMPFFENSITRFLGAIIVTMLVCISGVVNISALLFMELAKIIDFSKWGPVRVFIVAIIIGAILFFTSKLKDVIQAKIALEKARVFGEDLKESHDVNKIVSDSYME